MAEREGEFGVAAKPAGVNPGYAAWQIAKALTTSTEHDDDATRARAKERASKWATILGNILTGSLEYGSRTPVAGIPGWATLEVVGGGFATGNLLAGGPLQAYERKLLETMPGVPESEARRALNAHFLTDAGIAQLQERIETSCYDVAVPEEGALLVVAWLAKNGHAEDARGILEKISAYFSQLRFYPIPLDQPRRFGSRVHLQDAGTTLQAILGIPPNTHILAQKEACLIWAPLQDRIVALLLETVEEGWPCQNYPNGWGERALSVLGEYRELRKKHTNCGKFERKNTHSAQLLEFLGKCASKPSELTGREAGRLRHILNCCLRKRGAPDSPACAEARRRHAAHVSAPTFHEIAGVVAPRLSRHPKDEGLDDVTQLTAAVTEDEAAKSGVPAGTVVPLSIQRKIERCLNETVEILVERGLITSGETLAKVLPQMTSGLQAMGIADPTLRQLYAAIYRAFRRRRSLLLLNLEKQVHIGELPWIRAIEPLRKNNVPGRELAKQTLEEITVLTLTSFPFAILPNKLLQELRALVMNAGLDIPLVDELAADIFMGDFSEKFVESAKKAAELLHGSLYATYYGIDYDEVLRIPSRKAAEKRKWFWQSKPVPEFAKLCASRSGVSIGTWDPATNGMIIEQQAILTTQNLAALFIGLELPRSMRNQLGEMARQNFSWICKRQQMKIDTWHANLIMVKNTAYAWRQMVFFVSLLTESEIADFLRWAQKHLDKQPVDFQNRFRPALKGLALAANGQSLDSDAAKTMDARRFIGWSKTQHWLLANIQGAPLKPGDEKFK